MPETKNRLHYGDNLSVLRGKDANGSPYISDASVDLIYLDPPFNSRQDYNVLFAEKDGSRSASQITAFKDTWEWNEEAARSYEEVIETAAFSTRGSRESLRRCAPFEPCSAAPICSPTSP